MRVVGREVSDSDGSYCCLQGLFTCVEIAREHFNWRGGLILRSTLPLSLTTAWFNVAAPEGLGATMSIPGGF